MLTLNGPCSSFILMIRPMCGSSSATRMWQRRVAGSVTLDQGCDVAAVPAYVKEKAAEISRWTEQDQEQRVVSKGSDDCVTLLVLENRGVERSLNRRPTETLGFRDEGGNSGSEVFVVESRCGEPFDQQAVLSQHENGVNSRALAKRGCEVSDVGH